jgi:putative FmdB family regulatory protein
LIYEYECPGDGEKIEIEFPITAVPQNVMCSLCGTELKRIFTAPLIQFKGKGFYSTDN